MNNIALGGIAVLLLTVPGLAQDTSVSADPSVGLSIEDGVSASSAGGAANDGPLDAQITGDNTYGALIAAINAGDAVDLSAVTDENKISIVLVSTLQGDASVDGPALDAALTERSEALATLRTDATANAAITAKLDTEEHSLDSVVAVRTDANGNTLVFVDDRQP